MINKSFSKYIEDNQRKLMISLPNIIYEDEEEYEAVVDDLRTIIKEYISEIFGEEMRGRPRFRRARSPQFSPSPTRSPQLSPGRSPQGGRSPQLSPRF